MPNDNGSPWGYTPPTSPTETGTAQVPASDPAAQAADALLDHQQAALNTQHAADAHASLQLAQLQDEQEKRRRNDLAQVAEQDSYRAQIIAAANYRKSAERSSKLNEALMLFAGSIAAGFALAYFFGRKQ